MYAVVFFYREIMKRTIGIIELFITAIIWGTAFVAQSMGNELVGPFTFNASRYVIGSLVLIPLVIILNKKGMNEPIEPVSDKEKLRNTLIGGVFCGIALTAGSSLQQVGLLYTTVGKAGFGTSLYIIIVPIMGIFLKKKVPLRVWIAALIAIAGFYFMCMSRVDTINKGDLMVLIGAFAWSIHIHTVDHFAPRADTVMMSSVQFAVSSLICWVIAGFCETIVWADIVACAFPILYAGIMSCGIAYTLQIIGQVNVEPSLACLIMSLESVVSAIAGWIILGQSMIAIEIFGAMMVFAGVIIAQLPEKESVK